MTAITLLACPQRIFEVSSAQYHSDINYTHALLSSIVSAFNAPINISASQIQNLAVTTGGSRYLHRILYSPISSIDVTYQILINSKYPSAAYSSQLSNFVSSGSFTTNLHNYALLYRTPGFMNASCSSVAIGEDRFVT